jgi:hypothetical protein
VEDLAVYPFQACGFGVLDYQLHQDPAQASAVKVRSQQDRILAGLMDRVGVESDDAEHLTAGLIDGDKGHRACIIELRQFGDELCENSLMESKKRSRKSSLVTWREGRESETRHPV